jgi:PPE-repeat protein
MDVELDPDWGEPVASALASDDGAGTLGFAGTVPQSGARAVGLTTLAGGEFGGGPRMPMLPNTWDPEAPGVEPEDG